MIAVDTGSRSLEHSMRFEDEDLALTDVGLTALRQGPGSERAVVKVERYLADPKVGPQDLDVFRAAAGIFLAAREQGFDDVDRLAELTTLSVVDFS